MLLIDPLLEKNPPILNKHNKVEKVKTGEGVNLPQDAEKRRRRRWRRRRRREEEEEEERPGRKVWLLQLICLQSAASMKSLRVPSKDRQEVVSSSDIIGK